MALMRADALLCRHQPLVQGMCERSKTVPTVTVRATAPSQDRATLLFLALYVLILCLEELSGSQLTSAMPLSSPGTNGSGPGLKFHSQRLLLQLAHPSLEITSDGSMPREALEAANVFDREMGFGQHLRLFEHSCSLR